MKLGKFQVESVFVSLYIYIYIYIYISFNLYIYNSVGVKKSRLYNLQILQTDIWEKEFCKKRTDEKHACYLKIIKQHICLVKRKKTLTELPKLKCNKVLNT